ncbi:nuclear transport factor 2 family protein [Actinosynnema sp. NPDC020468]|uniref:nuclear transport factor 2 family protein n=1 Tax=Actinosynnema sp. NPDC020468 TaxID=3154488 RepID=UPI0033CEB291
MGAVDQVRALFPHVFDNRDVDRFGLVFTEDAVIELTMGGGREVRGLAAIREFALAIGPDRVDHHTLDSVVFRAPGDPAEVLRVRSRYLAVLVDGSVTNGDYLDEFRDTPAGWRIARRVSVPRFPLGPKVALPAREWDRWLPDTGVPAEAAEA